MTILMIFNGLWTGKENIFANAYKSYTINSFYNDLYEKSKNKQIKIYMDKTPHDEDDVTILPRLKEYGVRFILVNKIDKNFKKIKTESTITDSYSIKF